MVSETLINRDFRQSYNSCVLAGYGGAAYYYTQIPILEFFKDYCRHYKLNNFEVNPEKYYVEHFNGVSTGWWAEKVSGFQIIEKLHNESNTDSFVKCREKFNLSFNSKVDTIAKISEIEEQLKKSESLLCVSYPVEGGAHIVVAGFNRQFYSYNYGLPPGVPQLRENLNSIAELSNTLNDSLLLSLK